MKKIKIYLDTSVISHLDQADSPEKMADTLAFWEYVKNGEYEIYLSSVTLNELGKCEQGKRDKVYALLAEIEYNRIEIDDEVREVANQVVELRILTPKSYDDCLHIASAVVSGCDIILSWNFRHIVNIKTIKGVRAITSLRGYGNVDIIQPTSLLKGEENDD